MLYPKNIEMNSFILGIIVLSILFKEWMARFSIYLGKKINSQALKADGAHHRSDSLSSIVVLIGVVGNYYGFQALDSIGGIILYPS